MSSSSTMTLQSLPEELLILTARILVRSDLLSAASFCTTGRGTRDVMQPLLTSLKPCRRPPPCFSERRGSAFARISTSLMDRLERLLFSGTDWDSFLDGVNFGYDESVDESRR
jgi:hypothetical protein